MSCSASSDERLKALVDRICDGILTQREAAELETLLLDNPQAQRRYQSLVRLDGYLRREFRQQKQSAAPSSPPLVLLDAETARNPFGHSSSGWPMAYLVATMVMVCGLVVLSYTYVSHPSSPVRRSMDASARLANASPKATAVGQITGMIDCVWEGTGGRAWGSGVANRKSEVIDHKSNVHLGDTLAIRSGLLEITYGTGARVILQGPVTYEVESSVGGYLAVGKLTAKLERKSEVRGQRSEPANQKSEIANQTFVVRTPTALVTDLGTEFGVEVDKHGDTTSHVFRGLVEVQPTSTNGQSAAPLRLTENESVRVEKQQDGRTITVHRGAIDARSFVRSEHLPKLAKERALQPFHRWQAYSRQLRKDPSLVVYYTCESPDADRTTLPNVAATGSAMNARIEGPEWTTGRLPGKSALRFRGEESGDKVVIPEESRFNFIGAFSLAVWCKAERPPSECQALVAKGNTAWRIIQYARGENPRFDTGDCYRSDFHFLYGQTRCFEDRWHLVVAVYEPGEKSDSKRLYVDGRLEGESHDVPRPLPVNDQPLWLGSNSESPKMELQGWIDEVAIFSRALSARDITEMFHAADAPARATLNTGDHTTNSPHDR
jgi:hypothetical protein